MRRSMIDEQNLKPRPRMKSPRPRTRQQDAAELGADRAWQMAIDSQRERREQEAYKRQQDECNRRRLIEQDMRQSMIDEQNRKRQQMQTWAFDEGVLAKTLIDSWQDGKDANGNPTRNSVASQDMINYMRQSGNPKFAGLVSAFSAADVDGNPFMSLRYEDGRVVNVDPCHVFDSLSVFDQPDGKSYVLGHWGGSEENPMKKSTNDYLQQSLYRNRLSRIGQPPKFNKDHYEALSAELAGIEKKMSDPEILLSDNEDSRRSLASQAAQIKDTMNAMLNQTYTHAGQGMPGGQDGSPAGAQQGTARAQQTRSVFERQLMKNIQMMREAEQRRLKEEEERRAEELEKNNRFNRAFGNAAVASGR